MNAQIFTCPNCQVKFKLKDGKIEKLVKLNCPKCKKLLYIRPKSFYGENSTKQMSSKLSESNPIKMYDLSIQNEIIEDFLRYHSSLKEESKEPIAIIGDEPREFRNYLNNLLESIGFRTFIADNGRDVLLLLQKNFPDILFINVYLPIIMGINICEKIKSHSYFKKIKIILIGTMWRTDRFKREPSNLYGADEYIEEAVSKKELFEKIQRILPKDVLDKLFLAGEPIKDTDIEYAKRLARIIFSDIELYNSEKIKKALIEKVDLRKVLEEDIEEGRAYYKSKVSPPVLANYNFFEEYLEKFLKNTMKSL